MRPAVVAITGAGLPFTDTVAPVRLDPRIAAAEPGANGPALRLAAFTTPGSLTIGMPPIPILATNPSAAAPEYAVNAAPWVAGKFEEPVTPAATSPDAQLTATA